MPGTLAIDLAVDLAAGYGSVCVSVGVGVRCVAVARSRTTPSRSVSVCEQCEGGSSEGMESELWFAAKGDTRTHLCNDGGGQGGRTRSL